MNCDELELLLSTAPDELSGEERAHLAACERCRAFEADARAVLQLAAMPPPTAEVRAQLAGLAPRVLEGLHQRGVQRSRWRRVLGYAVAACVGALLASGVQWVPPRLERGPAPATVVAVDEGLPFAGSDTGEEDLNVAPEEVFFEVTWPSPEGEFL